MSELEKALSDYNANVALANLNLDEVPTKVRAGKEGQKRQAQANLETMEKAYGEQLRKVTFGLAVMGPGADKFIKEFVAEADTSLVVNGAEIYQRIADRVAPAMGNTKEFGVSHYGIVITELRTIANELNILSMPSPKWSEPVSVATTDGLLNHVRSMVDSSAGVELTSLYLRRQISNAGLKAGSDAPTVPVLVTGLDPQTAEELLVRTFPEGRFALVNTKETTTKEDVLEAIKNIKQQIKKNKTKTN